MWLILASCTLGAEATADTVAREEPPRPEVAQVVENVIVAAFPAPYDAVRAHADAFGTWLRTLPLRPPGSPVHTYTGDIVAMPAARVVDLPVAGEPNLQCADSALRLRATWERSVGRFPEFHYTSGDLSRWADWARGMRPRVRGREVTWLLGRAPDSSEGAFQAWLRDLYVYAGSYSLILDTIAVTQPEPGDLLVAPGSPGHVVVLLDVARNLDTTWVLAGQGYMPAMEFHVVAGPDGGWFPVGGDTLATAPIPMAWSGLRRWK